DRRRPEPAQIPADDMTESGCLAMRDRRNPGFREAVQVGSTLLPGAGRRNANHIKPLDDASPRRIRQAARRKEAAQLVGAQRATTEIAHPRPEPDVTRRRVLRLQPTDAFQCRYEGQGRALQQELASQQRPIELAARQRTLGGHSANSGSNWKG